MVAMRRTSLFIILFAINVVNSFPQGVSFPGQGTGRSCRTNRGERGNCARFLSCQPAIDDIRKSIYPTICGFGSGGIRDIQVCCPKRVDPLPTQDHFAKFADVCGQVSQVLDNSRRFGSTTPSTFARPGELSVSKANLTIVPTIKPGILITTPRTRFPIPFTSPRTHFPFDLATHKFKPELELKRPQLFLERHALSLRAQKKRAVREAQLPLSVREPELSFAAREPELAFAVREPQFPFPERQAQLSLALKKPQQPSFEDFVSLLEKNKRLPSKGEAPNKLAVTPPINPIVGGHDSFRNAWPWMALLGRKTGSQTQWFCGGVLITDQHILTAAHCFYSISKPDVVRLGEHDLSKTTESPHIDVQASTVFRHPSFSSPAVHDDIAIIKLASPVKFSNYIRPICMPLSDFTPSSVGVRGTITGWGTTSFGGRSSDILQQVSVPIVNKRSCDAAYKGSPVYRRSFPQGFPDNLFCASEEQGGKDACQGDSGGPYMIQDGSRYRVAGVVSAGQGCGSKTYPGLYTWVFPYLQWMQETVAK